MTTPNTILEPVEVIAHFDKLKIKIVRFKWNGTVFNVSEMLRSWKVPEGNGFIMHYIVVCKQKDLLCELSYNNMDMKWELVQYNEM